MSALVIAAIGIAFCIICTLSYHQGMEVGEAIERDRQERANGTDL